MNYDIFFEFLSGTKLSPFVDTFKKQVSQAWDPKANSDIPSWLEAYNKLPNVSPSVKAFSQSAVHIGSDSDLSPREQEELKKTLQAFHPWRKGPFELFGVFIDTEWRSDWKWERLEGKMAPLKDRDVLDIGCGSGYHCWRMKGEGANAVVGIEPALIYAMQFEVIQRYAQEPGISVLPMGVQHLPNEMAFDSVFSMGLLYHRRDPKEHLNQLKSFLRPGGELILETLVMEGKKDEVLEPKDRYAQMRNVWNIPSLLTLEDWMTQTGYQNVRCVDVTVTTTAEQRTTDWMTFQSLKDFLDPSDSTKTIEGYPAPKRAIFLAEKPV